MQDKRVLYRGRVAMFEEQCEELMKAIKDDCATASARRTDVETAVQRVEVCRSYAIFLARFQSVSCHEYQYHISKYLVFI